MSETLTPAQRRTLPARQALAAKFASTEEKTEYFGTSLVVVTSGVSSCLATRSRRCTAAYTLLARIAERPSHDCGVDGQARSDRIDRETGASTTDDPETVT